MTPLFNDSHFHWLGTTLLSAFRENYELAEHGTKKSM